jgi:spermidine synthase
VLTAAERYFGSYTNGLFRDPRVELIVADGREYLARRSERYDVIVSDLFVPWQAGAGSLYTREHYATVRARLSEGGLFAQWVALYQVSERELAIIVRTMLDVFPHVTLWRGDFLPDKPIVVLVGQEGDAPLDPAAVAANVRRIRGSADMDARDAVAFTALMYAGNLALNDDLFRDAAVNTDDRPVLEYLAPRTQRDVRAGRAAWLTLGALDTFYDRLFTRLPPERDPHLRALSHQQIGFVRAGEALHRAFTFQRLGRVEEARALAARFVDSVPYDVAAAFDDRLAPLR